MLTTDAFAYLDIDNPVCAWATYRGALVCAPAQPGFLSVWSAGLIRAGNLARIGNELTIEAVRVASFGDRTSRLRGVFCFADPISAERAREWKHFGAGHFKREYMAELSLIEASGSRERSDANWITYAPTNGDGGLTDVSWIPRYWAGEPFPTKEPIWETLVDGRLLVLGTDLRKAAYAAIKSEFPQSLLFLEMARMAAQVGSDLGSITAFLLRQEKDLRLDYLMNMQDTENIDVLDKMNALWRTDTPPNWADIEPHYSKGSFGNIPDLRPYGFSLPLR